MKSLLGQVIGSYLANSNGEISFTLPRGANNEILVSIFKSANKITDAKGFTKPFAVQIIPGDHLGEDPIITKKQVISYRKRILQVGTEKASRF